MPERKPPFVVQVFVTYCLVALSSFLIVSEQNAGLATSSQEYQIADNSLAASNRDVTVVNRHPSHVPVTISPVILEAQFRGSNESTDGDDDEIGKSKICWDLSIQLSNDLFSKKSLLLELKHKDESRSTISLFVLHHSWKSFLS